MDFNSFGQMLSDLGQSPEFARNMRGAFGRPDLMTQMAIANGTPEVLLEREKLDAVNAAAAAEEQKAQRQAEVMSRVTEWAQGKEPAVVLSQLLRMGVKPTEAVAITKQLNTEAERVGNYGWNAETGKYELLPGLPDPAEEDARRQQIQMDTFNQQADIRESKKNRSDWIKMATDRSKWRNAGVERHLTRAEAEAMWDEQHPSDTAAPKAGNAAPTAKAPAGNTTASGGKLTVGTVKNGYRYKGGDYKSPDSWEPE